MFLDHFIANVPIVFHTSFSQPGEAGTKQDNICGSHHPGDLAR
jgi:hypothetical protein